MCAVYTRAGAQSNAVECCSGARPPADTRCRRRVTVDKFPQTVFSLLLFLFLTTQKKHFCSPHWPHTRRPGCRSDACVVTNLQPITTATSVFAESPPPRATWIICSPYLHAAWTLMRMGFSPNFSRVWCIAVDSFRVKQVTDIIFLGTAPGFFSIMKKRDNIMSTYSNNITFSLDFALLSTETYFRRAYNNA